MPLSFDAPDAGRVNLELRRQRGGHTAKATGPAERLGKLLLPELVQIRGEDIVLPFDVVVFLSYPLLRVKTDMRNQQVIKYVVCIERMGLALEKALSKYTGESPRRSSALRAWPTPGLKASFGPLRCSINPTHASARWSRPRSTTRSRRPPRPPTPRRWRSRRCARSRWPLWIGV